MSDIAKLNSRPYPSNIHYCKCCGGNGYEGSDCESLREAIYGLRAELREARAVIRNTAETVQAFREQAEKLREQRDRAIEVARKLFDLDDEEWACCGGVISELTAEISKEKEGK